MKIISVGGEVVIDSDSLNSQNFDKIDAHRAIFEKHDISKSSFRNARLVGCFFGQCNAEAADFFSAVLINSSFHDAVLVRANFSNCDLRYCDFTGANLDGAIFDGANTHGASF